MFSTVNNRLCSKSEAFGGPGSRWEPQKKTKQHQIYQTRYHGRHMVVILLFSAPSLPGLQLSPSLCGFLMDSQTKIQRQIAGADCLKKWEIFCKNEATSGQSVCYIERDLLKPHSLRSSLVFKRPIIFCFCLFTAFTASQSGLRRSCNHHLLHR